MIRNKLEEYLAVELHTVERQLKFEEDFKGKNNIYWGATQRAFGAFELAELCGLDKNICKDLYEIHKNKLTKLLFYGKLEEEREE